MIEDKKNKIKIAESEEEATWERVRDSANKEQIRLATEIEINKAIEKLAEEKLREMRKGRVKYVG